MTQPRVCKCIVSDKTYAPETDQILDTFAIQCFGQKFTSDLIFNTTDTAGVFVGQWNQANIPILSNLRFNDAVVDVGRSIKLDGSIQYDWAVEFQCTESKGKVAFYAFNFYSITNTMEHFDAMKKALVDAGLSRFLENGNPLQIVDHSDCWYAAKP